MSRCSLSLGNFGIEFLQELKFYSFLPWPQGSLRLVMVYLSERGRSVPSQISLPGLKMPKNPRKLFLGAGALLCGLSWFVLGSRALAAEANAANAAMSTITVEKVQNYVNVLADDSFEGRETGSRGGAPPEPISANNFKNSISKAPVPAAATTNSSAQAAATSSPSSKAAIPI